MIYQFLFFLSLMMPSLFSQEGMIVAFAGLSGSGKTTIAKALEQIHPYYILLTEPEESNWPNVITNKEMTGFFSMWMGFRQLWLPQQYEAQLLRSQNHLVILDSYFIKIIGMNYPKPEWNGSFQRMIPISKFLKKYVSLILTIFPTQTALFFSMSYLRIGLNF